jgi:hypothetical protein
MLKALHRPIQNKTCGMLTAGVVPLHGSACPLTAACTQALLGYFSWEWFDYPHYGPDLILRNCHMFTFPKDWLRSQRFSNNEELMEGVKMWQYCLTQAYNILYPNISILITAVTILLCSLIMCISFVYFFLFPLMSYQILLPE